LGFDIGIEKRPVDCAVDYPGRCQSVLAQTGDERLGNSTGCGLPIIAPYI
jgi:hypothetical protein